MRVLSITHEPGWSSGGGEFEAAAVALGHELTVWCVPESDLPGSPRDFDAVMVFGGAMHPDQDDKHPWLGPEVAFIREALGDGVPLLGVCLGAQLVARAADAGVGPAATSEVGWHEVVLTPEGARDPVLGAFPQRFTALEWHHYTWELPEGAELLATSASCRQAFRLGDRTWAVQFHPEVNESMLDDWIRLGAAELSVPEGEMRTATTTLLPPWMEQGRALVEAFLREAEAV